MTSHHTSNRNTSPIKPNRRNRLGITARLPRWAFAALIALCGIGLLQDRIRRVRPAHALLLGVAVLMLLGVGWMRWCV
ncbi:hypothetical protein [Pseudomonas sp. D2002]|uniref:hypothetical protein n=1 Tax=Pseudomonas sp. D2002 TaxID=2726980 RepID=UPI0015A1E85D|nr:hypothetical protein [Pseudomonas sp. D2002]NWA85398.1 hypothetical protein [Pseudomonas sp. D2002]